MCILKLGGFVWFFWVFCLFLFFLCSGYPFSSDFQWYLLVNHKYFLTYIGWSELSHLNLRVVVWFCSNTAQEMNDIISWDFSEEQENKVIENVFCPWILKLNVALQYLCFHSTKKIPVIFEREWIWLLSLLILAPLFAGIENGRREVSCRNIGRKLKSDL